MTTRSAFARAPWPPIPSQSVAMRVLLEIAADQDDLAGGVLHIEDILKAGGSDVPASAWLTLAGFTSRSPGASSIPPSNDVILHTRLPILQQAAAQVAARLSTRSHFWPKPTASSAARSRR